MDQDTRDELNAVQRRWLAGVAELRQARQDIVMRALAEGNSKYAIAKVLHVAGPTVDAIIKTAERDPAAAAPAERPARRRKAATPPPEPEASLRPAAGRVPFREPDPEAPAPKRKNCTHPGVVKGVCRGCGVWVGKKS